MAQAATQPRTSPVVERNLHEMLRDTPAMNESSNAVHSGTTPPNSQIGYDHGPASLPNSNCKLYLNFKQHYLNYSYFTLRGLFSDNRIIKGRPIT